MSGAMVIAGESGGKSTFIGAFITYVKDIEGDKYRGDYDLKYGSEYTFNEKIYQRIQNHQAYPPATARIGSYVVDVSTNSDDGFAAKKNLTMMDIPGEIQQDAIDRLLTENIDEEEIVEAYNHGRSGNTSIRDKIDQGRKLSDREEEDLYLYQYLSSERVVFLLNIHKFIHRQNLDPVLTPKLVDRVANEKRCLLLITAVDEVGYDPSTFRSGSLAKIIGSLSVSPRLYDTSLHNYLTNGNNLPPGIRSSEIKSLVRKAEDNDISMFGVAVPEGPQGDIQLDQGHIKTQGFDNIVHWLMET